MPSAASLHLYVINLDRAPQRWAGMQARFADVPWPLTRIPALDAREQPQAVLSYRGLSLELPPAGVGWNPLRERLFSLVEEACFSSHLIALKTFLKTDDTHALILEDDAEHQRDMESELKALLQEHDTYDIIKLEGGRHKGRRLALAEKECGAGALVRSLRPNSGAAAYLVTKHGAACLVASAGKLCVPFDDYLNSRALHGATILHLSPWLFHQSGAESTMVGERLPHRHVKRRDPYHYLAQALRRGRLRLLFWRDAFLYPRLSYVFRLARW